MEDNYIWTEGIETALQDIRVKCINSSEYHKNNYYFSKDTLSILEYQRLFYLE